MKEGIFFMSVGGIGTSASAFILGQIINEYSLFLCGEILMVFWMCVMVFAFLSEDTNKTEVGNNGSGQH